MVVTEIKLLSLSPAGGGIKGGGKKGKYEYS